MGIGQLSTCIYYNYCITGIEIVTKTVAFATEFFPFVSKISGEVANWPLVFTFSLSKQKG